MPVPQKQPGNAAELLKLALFERQQNERPGQVPSSMAQNAYLSGMPNTNEQEREAGVLADADARYASNRAAEMDLNQEETAVRRGAQVMGYESPRAQQEAAEMSKLRQVLLPAQARAREAASLAEANRGFTAQQNEANRNAKAEIVNTQQGGQNQRTQAGVDQRAAQFDKLHPPSVMDRLRGVFGGSQPAAQATAATVEMMTPDGRVMDVPAGDVSRMEALGAKRQ